MRKLENPEIFRENICKKLNHVIKDEKKSRNMERGVYNYTLKEAATRKVVKKWDNPYFVQIYVDRLRSIYINLKNPVLIEHIQNGTLKSHNVAFMTHQEMMPEKWDTMIQEKIKRDKNKYETTIEAATDTFKCRKCHSNKCTYYQMQTRSADEPMTTFVSCIECGNRWKC
jgi:transcription elongation factor S-II